jgi:hypothetical protein
MKIELMPLFICELHFNWTCFLNGMYFWKRELLIYKKVFKRFIEKCYDKMVTWLLKVNKILS